MIHHGDCLDVMAGMDPESIDAIVTDPPYGLEFMGKEWDKLWTGPGSQKAEGYIGTDGVTRTKTRPVSASIAAPTYRGGRAAYDFHLAWAEAAYRVAKPSAYLLAFGGTRTVHRMTVALEDAGWIIRDMLVWGYASGFPKSKASLKPAWEPIVMARKPGPLRMLAIDECRLPVSDDEPNRIDTESRSGTSRSIGGNGTYGGGTVGRGPTLQQGRWPANIVLSDPIFDGGIEGVVGGGETGQMPPTRFSVKGEGWGVGAGQEAGYGDTGTYSRFFLIPKAARSDREPVTYEGDARANVHPTVKPVDLMRHLVRLVTPTGGTVLDPFLGSGTTALAAEMEGFPWIGIEREAEYVAIAEARLNGTQKGMAL